MKRETIIVSNIFFTLIFLAYIGIFGFAICRSSRTNIETIFFFSQHAKERMAQRNISYNDVVNAIGRGIKLKINAESYMYKDERYKIGVVIHAFSRKIITVYRISKHKNCETRIKKQWSYNAAPKAHNQIEVELLYYKKINEEIFYKKLWKIVRKDQSEKIEQARKNKYFHEYINDDFYYLTSS